jgi:hypothetical protein
MAVRGCDDLSVDEEHSSQPRGRQHGGRQSRRDNAAAVQQDDLGSETGDVPNVMRRENHCRAPYGQRAAQLQHGQGVLEIKVCGRLVQQQNVGLRGETARERDALALAARQPGNVPLPEVKEITGRQRVVHCLSILDVLCSKPSPMGVTPHRDDFFDGECEVAMGLLRQKGQSASDFSPRHLLEWVLVECDCAIRERPHSCEYAEQRAFPAAVRSDDGGEDSGSQRHRDLVENPSPASHHGQLAPMKNRTHS